jgi:long-chain acyl-CoA synthetase
MGQAQETIDELTQAVEGQTLTTAFLRTLDERGGASALRWRDPDGTWGRWTWPEYAERVARAAAGLRALGVSAGDRVVIMVRNCPEFHVVDVAATFLGATPVSIYNSSSPDQVAYLVGHCDATVAVVEDTGFLERFVAVRDQLPALRKLVVVRDPEGAAGPDVTSWATLLDHDPVDLAAEVGNVTPASLATVIYTSGTTGPPKGVMLTHFNVVYTAEALRRAFGEGVDLSGKRVVSYLPMAHIAERMTSHYSQVVQGYEVTSCPEPTLIAEYLREVRPHIIFGVPRVWEKIHAGVSAALAADPERQAKFDEGVAAAMPIALDRSWGRSTPEQDALWDFLQDVAFRPLRELVGLDEVEYAISGAAPIPRELLEWYQAVGVPLSEIYGMSETSGPLTWTPDRVKPGTVGPAVPGYEVALGADGEIICRGGAIFSGYLDDPVKTAEAIDDDGWLHTGDIGEIDDDGYYKVVDRKKELIITAGGKNISPANLEAALKTIPLIGQACAIGDNRPFVSALVVLDAEVAPAWARQQGIEADGLAALAAHPAVVAEVERGVAEAMAAFNNAERVKKVSILAEEWQPDSEELTPTSKLKRRGVHARYAAQIEALYTR